MTSLKGEVGHTPGPWMVEPDPSHFDSLTTIVGGKIRVAEAAGKTLSECEANAALISAAPDLLEALKGAEAWLDRWAVHVGSCAGGERCSCGLTANQFEARAAIAKASALTSLKD